MSRLDPVFDSVPAIKEWHHVDRTVFEQDIQPRHQPAVLKGLVNHWPLLNITDERQRLSRLGEHSLEKPLQSFHAAANTDGFFTFSDDLKSFNFERRNSTLRSLLASLDRASDLADAPYQYAGAINIPEHLPGFLDDHAFDLLPAETEKLISLWVGSRSRVPAHWDLPDNVACVVAGRRRFTLFPNTQIPNLYIGPLDVTIAGQPSSIVDFHAVDQARFPRFTDAVAQAQIATLEPGDAIYIPSLWLHHVESLDTIGALVNVWWREGERQRFTPLLTLMHGLLSLRDLPRHERQAWRVLFDHYLFDHDPDNLAHLPQDARSVLGELSDEDEQRLRAFLANRLTATLRSRSGGQ